MRETFIVALAGVFTGLGATPEEADAAYARVLSEEVGQTPGEVMRQCAEALRAVRRSQ